MPRRRIRVTPAEAVRDGVAAILAEAKVPAEFPAEALAEAAAARVPTEREDLREVPFFTIDPPGARDLDQAMAIERLGGGGFEIRYAIADLGAFVVAGGALDRAVHERGVTVYLPDGNVPLHPRALSEGVASLLPDVDRVALVWHLRLAADGELLDTRLAPALVRSRESSTTRPSRGGWRRSASPCSRRSASCASRALARAKRSSCGSPSRRSSRDPAGGRCATACRSRSRTTTRRSRC